MYIKILNVEIRAERWPWMINPHNPPPKKYGWGRVPGMGRFGGGWQYQLGIDIGRWNSFILNLIWGSIRVSPPRKCHNCGKPILSGQRSGPWVGGGYDKHLACFEEELEREFFAEPTPAPAKPFADDDIPF